MQADQYALALYNEAMVRLGETKIDSFRQDIPHAEGAEAVWSSVTRQCLSLHEWSFAIERLECNRLTAEGSGDYPYRYTLPAEGDLRAVYRDISTERPHKAYRLMKGEIWTDIETCWVDMRTGGEARFWPDAFKQLVQTAIAAHCCVQVTGSRTMAADLKAEAFGTPGVFPHGGLCAHAKNWDAQQHSGGVFTLGDGPLDLSRL